MSIVAVSRNIQFISLLRGGAATSKPLGYFFYMKTSVVLFREMGNFSVAQRTSDGMFNATELLKRWNSANPYHQRDLENFWKSTNLNEFMKEIVENECNFKSVEFTDKVLIEKINKI